MSWRGRLRELILAGGTLALGGCSSSLTDGGGMPSNFAAPCGNGIPDPCICGRPDASEAAALQCDLKIACEADGGTWNPFYVGTADGAVIDPHCDPPDGGVD